MARYRVSVDTGGTFSDFVLQDLTTGQWSIIKVPSTPDDPSRAIADGITELALAGVATSEIAFFSHGTTVGTNALLEGKGARVGLLVTEGFTGTYLVGHQARGHGEALFNLFFEKPALLAPPSRTGEIPERVGADGEIVQALDEEGARRAIRRVLDQGVKAIAICLLFSFRHPEHERAVESLVRALAPEVYVSRSSEVAPIIREYPRLSTTLINAYIGPILARYVERLHRRLEELGVCPPQRYIMQSNGGTATFSQVETAPITTILSGPAGGVAASVELGRVTGLPDLITFDMGGTSCDVALVRNLRPGMTTQGTVAGRDVAVPMLDIHTISAGGGTIARVDSHGVLQVGPDSAGAAPGPVCYKRGGDQVTITDCNLILGYLSDHHPLAGKVPLYLDAAQAAVKRRIAAPLDLPVVDAAAGVVHIVETQMAEAVKAISTRRGYDLRDFTLVAFGGAGPVHACSLALELGIPRVLVPPVPGCHSALGLLMTEVRHDYVRSRLMPLDRLEAEAPTLFDVLRQSALERLHGEGFAAPEITLDFAVDLRYEGQGYEVTVPWNNDIPALRNQFDQMHQQAFGHAAPKAAVEVISFRLTARGAVPRAPLPERSPASWPVQDALKEKRPVYFPARKHYVECPVYDRARIGSGHKLSGPAVIEQLDATTVVFPGQSATADRYGNLLIALENEP